MDDPEAKQPPGEQFNKIDLSALEAFQFGTQWTSAGDARKGDAPRGPGDSGRSSGEGPSRRDRRPPRRTQEGGSGPGAGAGAPSYDASSPAHSGRDRFGPRGGGGGGGREAGGGGGFPGRQGYDRGPGGGAGGGGGGGQRFERGGGRFDRSGGGGGGDRFDRGPRRPPGPPRPYESPVLEVTFYPDDHGFTALVKAMRASCRTYELFEIARLILGKPERCVVVFRRRAAEGATPEAPRAPLAVSVPTGLPFDTEEEAISYALEKNLDQFFTTEVVEVEPPKGTFQFVNRCPFTKDLLGPPNYHRYEQIVQQHYTTRGIRVPYDRYKASIEVVRDPEAVTQWLESMKKVTRFTYRGELPAGETGVFDILDDARAFLLRAARERVVRTLDSVRVSATVVEAAGGTEAFRAMSGAVDLQRRFPLDTANALRGRLRRENFNIFKRGSKGVTFVCSVRRKFRQPGQSFSESINQLIEFLDQNPMVPVSDLAPKLLGFTPPPPPAPAPAAPATPAAEAAPASAEPAPAADAPASATSGEAPAAAAPEVASAEDAPPPAAAPETPGLTPEQTHALNRLMIDLRWLVSEGYVAEYSDGRLVAHPVMTPQTPKSAHGADSDEGAETNEGAGQDSSALAPPPTPDTPEAPAAPAEVSETPPEEANAPTEELVTEAPPAAESSPPPAPEPSAPAADEAPAPEKKSPPGS